MFRRPIKRHDPTAILHQSVLTLNLSQKCVDVIGDGNTNFYTASKTYALGSFKMIVKHNGIRIGEIMVRRGILSEQQVLEILDRQQNVRLPFGVLAEKMFEVSVETIEEAWIEQYCHISGEIDLRHQQVDVRVLKLINRRQAWQFEILPLRFEPSGELLIAASRERLARAVTFAANRLKPIVYFRVAERNHLRNFLKRHYPMPEISTEIFRRAHELAQTS
ncbi:MAG: hypothetical protein HC898_11775 [Phycisphaerales bacterium]|nr:hypothetical protein [Phycisphaerales bacterium]